MPQFLRARLGVETPSGLALQSSGPQDDDEIDDEFDRLERMMLH